MRKFIVLTSLLFSISAATGAETELWKRTLQAGSQGNFKLAHANLDVLGKIKSAPIAQDKIDLAHARFYFQEGKFDKALENYNKIPKSSDYWLEALEEKAWSHLRKKDYDQTLSVAQTLLAPALSPQVGPEAYVLTSLTYLKICEYAAVFKTIEQFKDRYRTRAAEISILAAKGQTPSALKAIEKLAKGPVGYAAIGREVENLPRLFYRDERFQALLELKKRGNGQADAKLLKRLQALAVIEKKDYSQLLGKLHLIEAEAIQRVHGAERPQDVDADFEGDSNTLKFPHKVDGEVWLDELDSYQVRAANCPTLKGGKK